MNRIATFILSILSFAAHASHIAGGEFRMKHLSGELYRFDLIIFFDVINGNPGAKDPGIGAKIFRNSDNALVDIIGLTPIEEVELLPSQDMCSQNYVVINRLTYTAIVELLPEIYNDPAGYYIAWERCCRNYALTNIYSENVAIPAAKSAGQTFILEFPSVTKEGNPFINSSPKLNTPTIDYVCPNRPFYLDFSGQDVDGDSLAYSIVNPLTTHSLTTLPEILPKPYPEVEWRPSYSLDNIFNGSPDLKISKDGLLTVTPQIQGLFAFAVKCEEYREKVKIGEVRREFTILVVDGCDVDAAPEILAKSTGGSYNSGSLEVSFDQTVSDEDRCIQVKVTDADIATKDAEPIYIKAIPIGFDTDVSGVLPSTVEATLTQVNPFAEFSICFESFPPTNNDNFEIAIVAYDKSCSVPLTDTVRIKVFLDPSTLNRVEQNIVFPTLTDKTYGDDAFMLNASASSGLPITYISNDISIASISSSLVTLHQPGLVTIKAMQSGDNSYKSADQVDQTFCVNPPPPELTLVIGEASLSIQSSSESINLWYKDGERLENAIGNSVEVSGAEAIYTARAIVNDCISQPSNGIAAAEPEEEIVTGVSELISDGMNIFPNPVSNKLEIQFTSMSQWKSVSLFNVNGQKLTKHEVLGDTHTIEMNGLATGVYLLLIEIESKSYFYRIYKI